MNLDAQNHREEQKKRFLLSSFYHSHFIWKNWKTKHCIISASHLHTDICPLTGNYALRNDNASNNCSNEITLSSGCQNSHKMKLTTKCPEDMKGKKHWMNTLTLLKLCFMCQKTRNRFTAVFYPLKTETHGTISSDLYHAWRRDMKSATFFIGFLWIKAFAHLFVWDNGVQTL